ncbi:protein ARV1 [Angomonas deanei]|uniref:Protein ARV n=1 Tax=Angomonas deanei TaxID=59799 RepID=S9VQZ2_9TRYP|nr:protein ARV1 [Angomonas deanei]EPY34520.1 protein ARV1 [Angomonas deanei]EPY43343.1 protein ARV1 [Angomonas deanei]CAD2217437.1 Arv1-like family, putative [Angomonas deanei]|eukprot:EPY30017.1 protein ARV1 [Angomonas deanei]
MSRCIECGQEVPRLINPDTQTVEHCDACDSSVDLYFEFNSLHLWIDMILLQRRAWIHILYNSNKTIKHYLQGACISCFLEAFVSRSKLVITKRSATPELESIQIVKIAESPISSYMNYTHTLPTLFVFSASESIFILSMLIWFGKHFEPKGGLYKNVIERWVKAACIATNVKMFYALFLVWVIPLSALQIVDYIYFIWLFRAVSVMVLGKSVYFSVLHVAILSLLVGCRIFFRYVTEWSPQII